MIEVINSKITCKNCNRRADVLTYRKKHELYIFFKIRHVKRMLDYELQHEKTCRHFPKKGFHLLRRIKWFVKRLYLI